MIGRRAKEKDKAIVAEPKGFDDFQLRLGDVMRGERATMGKSLLDVQRELRIKASYIAAIENCDPEAFETQGFVAGYVRSYARYLDMDPDATFTQFCQESGFAPATGIDAGAKSSRASGASGASVGRGRVAAVSAPDPFVNPSTPYVPQADSVFSRVEPGAVGSVTVLLALVCALGYGGWTVLQEVQRVQVAPVERTPVVLSEIDPLAGAGTAPAVLGASGTAPVLPGAADPVDTAAGLFTPPQPEGLDRLYRPQALDVPVLVARDAPISSLDPSQFGAFAEASPEVDVTSSGTPSDGGEAQPLLAGLAQTGVQVVAVRPAWVRVRDAVGDVLFTGVMNAGDTYQVPVSAAAPNIEVGESGAVYFAVDGATYGPIGPRGTVTKDLSLAAVDLVATLPEAVVQADGDLTRVLAELGAQLGNTVPVRPQVVDANMSAVTVVAASEAWVRVRSAEGTVLFEGVMAPGDFYTAPATEVAPTIRAGNAGAIYFAAGGQTFGPFGANGAVADNLALSMDDIKAQMAVAEIAPGGTVAQAVAQLNALQSDAADQ